VRQGHDLQRHLAVLERSLGQQMMSAALGITPMDLAAVSDREHELMELKSRLDNLSPHLGPNNPQIIELENKIRTVTTFLADYRRRAGQRMASLSNAELEPLLRNMLSQAIDQAWH